jgi:mortality factor 4-like protein 1
MASLVVYAPNERVLCYHGPLFYEAKIIKVEDFKAAEQSPTGEAGMNYRVHYRGWKQT